VNHPTVSKINWTALVVILVNVAATSGLLPDQYENSIVQAVNILGPTLIVTFRTWYTEK